MLEDSPTTSPQSSARPDRRSTPGPARRRGGRSTRGEYAGTSCTAGTEQVSPRSQKWKGERTAGTEQVSPRSPKSKRERERANKTGRAKTRAGPKLQRQSQRRCLWICVHRRHRRVFSSQPSSSRAQHQQGATWPRPPIQTLHFHGKQRHTTRPPKLARSNFRNVREEGDRTTRVTRSRAHDPNRDVLQRETCC